MVHQHRMNNKLCSERQFRRAWPSASADTLNQLFSCLPWRSPPGSVQHSHTPSRLWRGQVPSESLGSEGACPLHSLLVVCIQTLGTYSASIIAPSALKVNESPRYFPQVGAYTYWDQVTMSVQGSGRSDTDSIWSLYLEYNSCRHACYLNYPRIHNYLLQTKTRVNLFNEI